MSEIKQNEAVEQEQNGGSDELVGAVFGKEAEGLGVCLSGAAGILVYRGMVVMLG